MQIKPTHLAGWCLFLVLLFLSVFYLLAEHLLSMPASWGARVSIALAEGAAYLGGAAALHALTKGQKRFRRLRPVSRVYYSFSLLLSLSAALGLFLLQLGFSQLMRTAHPGIYSLYPILMRNENIPFSLVFLTLILVPAVSQEILLRGGLFSIFEGEGTGAAVIFSTICMPLLYVYPSAAVPTLAIGAVCAMETFYTDSLWPAVLTHLLCRLALYCGDLFAAGKAGWLEVVVAVSVVLFLLCLFSFLRSCEGLLRDGLLERFRGAEEGSIENVWNITRTPGSLLFLALYIVRLVLTLQGAWR